MKNEKVLVYIIPDDTNVSRANLIERKFSSSLFKVFNVSRKAVYSPVSEVSGMTQDEIYDANIILSTLEMARKQNKKSPVIIVKNTSVSDSSAKHIDKITREVLKFKDIDLCYYCVWLDQCQLYSTPRKECTIKTKNKSTSLVFTHSPNGFQCIYFTPVGRDRILKLDCMRNGRYFNIVKDIGVQLNDEIRNGNLEAITTIPNVFEFDIDKNVRHPDDYLKANRCLPLRASSSSSNNEGQGSIAFFIIVLMVAIIIAVALIRLGPR